MAAQQPIKILIPIDWSDNAQKAFKCESFSRYYRLRLRSSCLQRLRLFISVQKAKLPMAIAV